MRHNLYLLNLDKIRRQKSCDLFRAAPTSLIENNTWMGILSIKETLVLHRSEVDKKELGLSTEALTN